VTNFSVFSNHVTIVPPIKAILESPDLRLDGFLGPGHVSTVIGQRPYRFVPAQYGKPLVTAGFEPLDILQAIAMLLTQIREGRCEVENQYTRVVRDEATRVRSRCWPRCSSCGLTSNGAASGSSPRAR
jgi:hydrogenase expression/formation protein HypD